MREGKATTKEVQDETRCMTRSDINNVFCCVEKALGVLRIMEAVMKPEKDGGLLAIHGVADGQACDRLVALMTEVDALLGEIWGTMEKAYDLQ